MSVYDKKVSKQYGLWISILFATGVKAEFWCQPWLQVGDAQLILVDVWNLRHFLSDSPATEC